MNKRIRRIVAGTLVISAFSIIAPSDYVSFMNTKAYARFTSNDLERISLGRGDIHFKASQTEYTLKLPSSVDELEVGGIPKDEDAEVTINGNEVSKDDNYRTTISLDKGENKIIIKVKNRLTKTYTLTVIRGHEDDSEIYLSDIKLSQGNIDFSQDKTSYDVNVPSDTQEVSVKAIPEDSDYDVEIDGVTAYEDNNYKRTISLENGDNKIDIRVEGADKDGNEHEKVYTLHINRATSDVSTQALTNATASATAKNENEKSQDAGNMGITKGWKYNNEQWSYFDENGNKKTGWMQVGYVWYYLDSNGIMKTGWQNINGQWYYLDSNGAMKTGWIKNSDGKWYYLYGSGAMAKNTVINGVYRLDSNGVWIH